MSASLASTLRTLANLVESGKMPSPGGRFGSTLHDPETAPGIVKDVMQAFPGGWRAEIVHSYGVDFYRLRRMADGFEISLFMRAGYIGTEQGQRTVTEWTPDPEIAALLDSAPGGEA